MSTSEIDHAVRYLKQHGCSRNPAAGRWMTADGDPLESDPVESASLFRRRLIQQEVDRTRAAGGWSHR